MEISEEARGVLLSLIQEILKTDPVDCNLTRNIRLPSKLITTVDSYHVIGGFLPATNKVFGETLIIHCDLIESPVIRLALFDLVVSFFCPLVMGLGKFWVGTDKLNKKIIFIRNDVTDCMPIHDGYSFRF
jgi:hypothetical protein